MVMPTLSVSLCQDFHHSYRWSSHYVDVSRTADRADFVFKFLCKIREKLIAPRI